MKNYKPRTLCGTQWLFFIFYIIKSFSTMSSVKHQFNQFHRFLDLMNLILNRIDKLIFPLLTPPFLLGICHQMINMDFFRDIKLSRSIIFCGIIFPFFTVYKEKWQATMDCWTEDYVWLAEKQCAVYCHLWYYFTLL